MTLATITFPKPTLGEQARGLRSLLRHRAVASSKTGARYRSLAVTSGKGGVGKSVLALNLAVAWAQQGARVCLLDASLGLGHLDLLCQRNGYWNLSHVVAGARQLEDVVLNGPAGVQLLPGAGSLMDLETCPDSVRDHLIHEMEQFANRFDVLLIDTGQGLHAGVRRLLHAADEALLVTTPDPMAIAEAYATLKAIRTRTIHLAVNQADAELTQRILDRFQETANTFLGRTLSLGTGIPVDAAVPQSLRDRQPFMLGHADSAASNAVRRLARQLSSLETGSQGTFFERMGRKSEG
jgi:flagellar biosynthesis protein FlhG